MNRRSALSRRLIAFLGLLAACLPVSVTEAGRAEEPVATFSCVGYDPETGDLGVAVQSKFFAVGSVVPWARGGVGAIATQAFANTTYGPRGLEMLAAGRTPEEVLGTLIEADSLRERRQVGIVDAQGRSVSYTGKECQAWAGGRHGEGFAAQGNILVREEVVTAMAQAFQETKGMLGDRLLAALDAAQAKGGDSRGMQSAALLIVRPRGGYAGFDDRYCDLRVDDAADPIAELRRIYNIWKPNALILEGYRLVDARKYAEAYERGREAVALTPDQGDPYYHLACYYARGGESEPALRTLEDALTRTPGLGKQASTDTDLAPLAKDPRFARMLSAAARAAAAQE